LEGVSDNRDFREINLDSATPSLFKKFVNNVANRRINMSSSLPHYISDFSDQLVSLEPIVPITKIEKELREIEKESREINGDISRIFEHGDVPIERLVELEAKRILLERLKNKPQPSLFNTFEADDDWNIDSKVKDAARLFASKRFKFPYYYSFDALADVANGNVEQFLSVASSFAVKMISRAELGRDTHLHAHEQQQLIRQSAERYYESIEQRFERGYAIKQLVSNLGLFFKAVTYRPNAPIAPGVNGFGFDKEQLRTLLASEKKRDEVDAFRQILTSAVAGNVLFVKETKQGQVGAEKIVFYLNRLLCAKYELPLSTGGWQHLKSELVITMMRRPVTAREWGKRWIEPLLGETEL
jgi:hypothetical protein